MPNKVHRVTQFSKIFSGQDVILAYIAQGLNVASSLIVLPIALHHLGNSEMAIWIVFITLAGLFQLLELGLQPTISRYVSYAYAGASSISMQGLEVTNSAGQVNQELLNDIYFSAKGVYFNLSLVGLLLVMVVGPWYIWSVVGPSLVAHAVSAWVLFGGGFIVQFYFSYLAAFIQGRGSINEFNKSLIFSKLSFVALSALLLTLDLGIGGLAAASLLSALVGRAYVFWAFKRDLHSKSCLHANAQPRNKGFARIVGVSSVKLGLVNVGAFMITRGNILIASSFLGLSAAGSYGLTYQVLSTLSSLSATIYTLKYPAINVLQASGKPDEALRLYGAVAAQSITLFLLLVTALILLGSPTLLLLKSHTYLLPTHLLIPLSLIFLLELNGSLSASFLTTQNTIPFLPAALISGSAVLAFGLFFCVYCGLGLLGLILAQGLVQAAYNNWKWSLEVGRRSGLPYFEVLSNGFRSLANSSLP